MAGKRLGADVRHLLEGFLLRRVVGATLAKADKRVHESGAPVRQTSGAARHSRRGASKAEHASDSRARSPSVSDPRAPCPTSFVMRDITGRGLQREKRRRLAEDVAKQGVANVAHNALSHVGHEVTRQVGPNALHDVDDEDGERNRQEVLPVGKHLVEDGLDQRRQGCRSRTVQHHRGQRSGQPRAVRARVLEQSAESTHSLNRYLSSTHNATTPSRQPIFFPSS